MRSIGRGCGRPAEATPAVVHESVPEAAADDVAARLAALGLPETSDDADQANRRRRSRVGNGAGLTERRDDVTDDAAAPEASIPADLRQQPRFDDDDPNSSRRNRRRRNRDRQNRRQRPGVSPVMERLEMIDNRYINPKLKEAKIFRRAFRGED